ncbi:MAG: adenosylhomocysteinase [Clostridiales Family XIII bacterium]|nr:adenosylhomocysteinase [Clostridiales Family XIII bacterium]
MPYDVKDIGLSAEGARGIDWVRANMPLLRALEEKYAGLLPEEKPLHNVKISLSIHMEPKTAYLCKVLSLAGAVVSATGSNVLSTQDSVAAALAAEGIHIYAIHGESEDDYFRHIEMCLEHKPNIVIDDGGDLVGMLHGKRPDLATDVWGGCEETTTGILRLNAMERTGELKFPMLAVNDARCKYLFDNRYGTGQSVWDSILRNTNLIIASKTVVVAGYGWCSKGIAMRAAALGASVIVTEIDPVKAIEARMDGYAVMTMDEAAPYGDIFISATGCKDVITMRHILKMKDRTILANAGHFNVEVDVVGLEKSALQSYEARKNITAYVLENGKTVMLMAEGRLVNLAAADGHPAEIMDMSFAVQFHAALYLAQHKGLLENRVHRVSAEIDEQIAREKLKSWGVKIDSLTPEQEKYLGNWKV